jgi:hypothetical protein
VKDADYIVDSLLGEIAELRAEVRWLNYAAGRRRAAAVKAEASFATRLEYLDYNYSQQVANLKDSIRRIRMGEVDR